MHNTQTAPPTPTKKQTLDVSTRRRSIVVCTAFPSVSRLESPRQEKNNREMPRAPGSSRSHDRIALCRQVLRERKHDMESRDCGDRRAVRALRFARKTRTKIRSEKMWRTPLCACLCSQHARSQSRFGKLGKFSFISSTARIGENRGTAREKPPSSRDFRSCPQAAHTPALVVC